MNILQEFKPIKLFVLDVDGVLTNGSLLLLENGQWARSMNIKDGYALQLAIKRGYQVLVISGAFDEAVRIRLNKLGIKEVAQGVTNKKSLLSSFVEKNHFTTEQVLYMGDDMPDVEVMGIVGLPCCPADAVSEIKAISSYISNYKGGEGCVRDVIEKVLKLNDDWDSGTSIASR